MRHSPALPGRRRAPTARASLPALIGAALCLSTTSCGSDSTAPAGSPALAPPASSAAAPTASGTPGTSAAPASPALPAACAGASLTVTTSPWVGTAGHGGFALQFRNHSAAACTLTGYPGVAALTAAGRQAVQATRTLRGYQQGGLPPGATTPPTVMLAPGQTAAAGLEWIENPGPGQASCPAYPAILVTPPGTTTSARLPAPHLYLCRDLQIHPVTSRR
jgi:hypothetical protein